MSLDRDGGMSVVLADGREVSGVRATPFDVSSMVQRSVYLPHLGLLRIHTVRGDDIVFELPRGTDRAPGLDRPTIYLDQNHWSTITHSLYEPGRVANPEELVAASRVVELARERKVILPMSFAHMVETCRQVDLEQRYRRALTIAQLSGGWQLRDPLEMRLFELQQAMSIRYRQECLIPPHVVTLEPNALHGARDVQTFAADPNLPEDVRHVVELLAAANGNLDAMLDAEHVPVVPVPRWPVQFEAFARFLAENPTGREMKRRRTHAKFIADLGNELPLGAHRARITPEQMREWTLEHSEEDLRAMPSLGLYREVMHEKLCNPTLPWEENDLTDMNYLAAGGGYCDHVVGERRHAAFLETAVRRLDRTVKVHRNLRSLVEVL